MVGFNRRFAPSYADLKQRTRDVIIMQKNRPRLPEAPRRVVFDDFVHVVDTLRSLVPGEVTECTTDSKVVGGELHHVAITLRGRGFVAFGSMSRMSGADDETLEIMGGGSKRRIENIGAIIEFDGVQKVARRPDWASVTQVRGFDRMCAHFLGAVERGERLCARDALATHAMCEAILGDVLANA